MGGCSGCVTARWQQETDRRRREEKNENAPKSSDAGERVQGWVKEATVTKELHLGQKYFFYGVLRFGLVSRFFMGLSEVLCEKGG